MLNGGVKTGRRIPIWSHLTRSGAPFSLDSKNRSFSSREKETGFERSLWEHLTPPHPSWPSAMTPSPLRGEGFKRCAVPRKESSPTGRDINHAVGLPLIRRLTPPPSPRGRLWSGSSPALSQFAAPFSCPSDPLPPVGGKFFCHGFPSTLPGFLCLTKPDRGRILCLVKIG